MRLHLHHSSFGPFLLRISPSLEISWELGVLLSSLFALDFWMDFKTRKSFRPNCLPYCWNALRCLRFSYFSAFSSWKAKIAKLMMILSISAKRPHTSKIAKRRLPLIPTDTVEGKAIRLESPPNANWELSNKCKPQSKLNYNKWVHVAKTMNFRFMNKVKIPKPKHRIGKTM